MYCQNCGKQIPDGATFCTECGASQIANTQPMQFSAPPITEKPKKKKTALWIILGIFALIIIIAIAAGGDEDNTKVDVTPAVTETANIKETDNSAVATQQAPGADANNNSANLTMGQKNALQKAQDYLSMTAFSHDGLVEQLEIGEKFAHEDAVYGADNCGADWNEQAAAKAKDYLDMMAFSRDGLIEQLEVGEKFTHEQAVYGVEANGY